MNQSYSSFLNMSLKQRRSGKQSAEAEDNSINDADHAGAGGSSSEAAHGIISSSSSSSSLSRRALSGALTGTASLAKLLPTGTLMAFQILIPVFTNKGVCDHVTHILTFLLLLLLAFSCILACFTDTVKSSDGRRIYHGIATFKGLWLFDYSPVDDKSSILPDLTKYKIRIMDFVHAFLSVLVFFAVALSDKNVLTCYYPKPGEETKEVLDIVPLGIGTLCSLLFIVFPSTRHGIGYPLTSAPK
ncbi:protein DMP3-like [Vicia villosa]|uniref:protein DMP3-like n=1 Tax=Vicia villosa TaxID=3911 RepID=UPI00273AC107|nr:protein DMP3-like [Vicia villosa]